MQVAVVILTYDPAPGMLESAVDSVIAAGGAASIVVVDNGRSASERLAGAGSADVRVIATGRNGGYGAGMNTGIRWALEQGADAVALLNDDVVVSAGWLEGLIGELAADVGAVQPTLVYSDTDPPIVNSRGVRIDRAGAGTDLGIGEPFAPTAGEQGGDIEVFTGGAVLLRREFLLDVGGFDERFFLYYEDVELARRGRRRGWRYRWAPATVEHRGSATTAALGDRVRYLQERNRLWSSSMHGSPAELVAAAWLSLRRLRHAPRRVHARALLAGAGGGMLRLVQRALGTPIGPRLGR